MAIRIHRNSKFINRYLSYCRQRIRSIQREVRVYITEWRKIEYVQLIYVCIS